MKRPVRVFRNFEEADKADRSYYASLTPQQRLDLMIELHEPIWRAPDGSPIRLQRVYRVTQLSRG